ncbi:ribonuclease HIII [Paenisporosarcina cavernae]|uniref:Ribonuclease HIII n=1 Tax=Paenisporosarcina cavernae TaxID=2320858 RepID=A0A385YTD1_9BACL|nr:ribonuclease HIII [Paenisporosarcina cavernae]AYC29804.1 ribonuclease HIII [Paenisporosarcina cavernae]
MSNIVIQLSGKELEKVKTYYLENKVDRNAPGLIFSAKLPDVVISIYRSGKIMFQGAGSEREASRWNMDVQGSTSSIRTTHLPENLSTSSVIGSDETGTGDFFGPMTVAACFVPHDKIALLKELGVKDSKNLTDTQMVDMSEHIKAACIYSVLILGNVKYNSLQQNGYNQGKMKAMMHNQVLKHVLRKIAPDKPDYILIDEFAKKDIYYRYIGKEPEIIRENVYFSTKAEGLHVAVAAASIIARVAFVEEMNRLSQSAGVTLPKGAGPKVDEIAAKLLLSKGKEFVSTITKSHFANTEKAWSLVKQKKRNT